jgi:hypothetical protein
MIKAPLLPDPLCRLIESMLGSLGDAVLGNWAEVRVGSGCGGEPRVDHADHHWEVTRVKSVPREH